MSLNGDLYFSHAVDKDSRRDYCCFAAFPRIRTIVQKTAMSVIVKTSKKSLKRLFFNDCLFPHLSSQLKAHPSAILFFYGFVHFYSFFSFVLVKSFINLRFVFIFTILFYVSSTSISEKKDTSPENGKFFLNAYCKIYKLTVKYFCAHCKSLNGKKKVICVVCQISDFSKCPSPANAILQRRPSIMTPSGVKSQTQLVKGEDLNLECIAAGL